MDVPDETKSAITAELAYKMYEQEGQPDGKADEHWARAERALGLIDASEFNQSPVSETSRIEAP